MLDEKTPGDSTNLRVSGLEVDVCSSVISEKRQARQKKNQNAIMSGGTCVSAPLIMETAVPMRPAMNPVARYFVSVSVDLFIAIDRSLINKTTYQRMKKNSPGIPNTTAR
jgi:hypothetical protein